jgi:hypothetical protein
MMATAVEGSNGLKVSGVRFRVSGTKFQAPKLAPSTAVYIESETRWRALGQRLRFVQPRI